MAEIEVLTREKAAPQNILPTGRTVGVLPIKGSGRVKLSYVDGKPGDLPAEFKGEYTGRSMAMRDLARFVNLLWDVSDDQKPKKK
jgi:hypothetical protein